MTTPGSARPKSMRYDLLTDYAPSMVFSEDPQIEWMMTHAERAMLIHLLERFRPEIAIEIGTFEGGSLQAISARSKSVFALDTISRSTLADRFDNVTFLTGDSRQTLPRLIDDLNASSQAVGFVLVDGDHSERGVKADVEACLRIRPRAPLAIVMHDSFNPSCRSGIQAASWADCPHVHYIDVDFVPGVFFPGRATVANSMWGGFAFAMLLPDERRFPLTVYQSQKHKFELCRQFAQSSGFLTASEEHPG